MGIFENRISAIYFTCTSSHLHQIQSCQFQEGTADKNISSRYLAFKNCHHCTIRVCQLQEGTADNKTLPVAQRTQGIESVTWMVFFSQKHFKLISVRKLIKVTVTPKLSWGYSGQKKTFFLPVCQGGISWDPWRNVRWWSVVANKRFCLVENIFNWPGHQHNPPHQMISSHWTCTR